MLICVPTKMKSKKGRVEVMEGVFVRLVPLLRTFRHKLLLHLEGRRKQKALLSSILLRRRRRRLSWHFVRPIDRSEKTQKTKPQCGNLSSEIRSTDKKVWQCHGQIKVPQKGGRKIKMLSDVCATAPLQL